MNFSEALVLVKAGNSVARTGWNGKSMFIFLVPGSRFEVTEGRPMAHFWPVGSPIDYRPHIDMRAADGTVVVWTASQSDILADDWMEVSL